MRTILLLFLALPCQNRPEEIPFTVFRKGDGVKEARQASLAAQVEWDDFLKAHPLRNGEDVPRVDFRTEMLILVTIGPQPNPGYGVEISRIEKNADGFTVVVKRMFPDPKKMYAQVITHPYVIVKLARTPGAVRFVEEKK